MRVRYTKSSNLWGFYKFLTLDIKIASAGAVRENPAEAFAKGGNSDERKERILFVCSSTYMICEE